MEDKIIKKKKKKKKKKRKKKGRRIGLMLLIILGGITVSYLVSKFDLMRYIKMVREMAKAQVETKEEAIEKEWPLVKVFHVVRTDFSDMLPIIGTVKGFEELELRFEVNGIIENINFKTGDLVAKHDVVSNLVQDEAKYKVEFQKANYETSQSTFLGVAKKLTNSEKMFNAGAIVVSKLDEAVLEAENAALKMKSARFEYLSALNEAKKTELRSPVDGVLAVQHMDVGEFVTSNEKALTVMDITRVYVEVGVVEKDVDKIAIGLTAQVSVDTYPGVAFEGILTGLSPVIEGKSRTMTAKIEVDNDQLLLLPGMFARTNISVYESKDTLMVPALVLNKTKDGYSVNVVSSDDTIETRVVEVIYFTVDREYVEISAGLEVDEFVIVESQQDIKEGDQVQVIEVQESIFAK